MTRREINEKALGEITALTQQVAVLTGEVQALGKLKDRTAEANKLLDDIAQLKRDKETLIEQHAREKRATEHEVGLLRNKQEQDAAHQTREIELKQQEAILKVREENLAADRKRFEEQMAFHKDQMKSEVDRLVDANSQLLAGMLDAMPKITARVSTPAAASVSTGRSRGDS